MQKAALLRGRCTWKRCEPEICTPACNSMDCALANTSSSTPIDAAAGWPYICTSSGGFLGLEFDTVDGLRPDRIEVINQPLIQLCRDPLRCARGVAGADNYGYSAPGAVCSACSIGRVQLTHVAMARICEWDRRRTCTYRGRLATQAEFVRVVRRDPREHHGACYEVTPEGRSS